MQATTAQNEIALWRNHLPLNALQSLLLTVHQHICQAVYPAHRLQRLATMSALLQLLGQRVVVPATCRYCVHILLQLLPEPQLQPACCELLQHIVGRLLTVIRGGGNVLMPGGSSKQQQQQQYVQEQHDLAVAVLGSLIPTIMSVLVQCIEVKLCRQSMQSTLASSSQPANDLSATDPLITALLQLLLGAPGALQPYLQSLELLPALPVLSHAVTLQQQWRQGLTLSKELVIFADRAASMAPASRQRALQALLSDLQQRQQDIFEHSSIRADVLASAWKLAHLAAQLDDPGISQLAGQLLAAAGWGKHHGGYTGNANVGVIAGADAAGGDLGGLPSKSRRRSGSEGPHDRLALAVMQQLVDGLVNPDVNVIHTAQNTLRAVLLTPEGARAVDALTESEGADLTGLTGGVPGYWQLLKQYITAFQLPAGGVHHITDADATASVHDITDPLLWQMHDKTHEHWLCDVCCSLLLACSNSQLLRMLAPAARLRVALAELLLPFALQELCTTPSDEDKPSSRSSSSKSARGATASVQGVPAMLGRQITNSVFAGVGSRNTSAGSSIGSSSSSSSSSSSGVDDVRSLGVILRCLEHLRSVHVTAAMAGECLCNFCG